MCCTEGLRIGRNGSRPAWSKDSKNRTGATLLGTGEEDLGAPGNQDTDDSVPILLARTR